jgi:hypothetical protein
MIFYYQIQREPLWDPLGLLGLALMVLLGLMVLVEPLDSS